ncbi:tetratricopeptide repeat protein [Micromonospora echinospora]|uniref:tetratricopeptide repeat protein n=1 Tax=Micromonospora echinospora TaxID=1877 RepID=UPI00366E3A5D
MSLVVRIALLRPLARRRPLGWGPRLAEALITRSQYLSGLPGSAARCAAAADEALALCRRLAADRPDLHRVDLARALVARVAVPDQQPIGEAIDQLEEALGYVDDPADRAALVVLATARQLLAANLNLLGESRRALLLALRARAAWDACAPLTVLERMRLARTLLVIGACHQALGRPEEACAVRQRAMDLYRPLSVYRQVRWTSVGLSTAVDLAQSLAATGRAGEALALIDEFRALLEFWPRVHPPLGRSLRARSLLVEAECRAALGETEAALRAAGQAVDLLAGQAPGAYPGALAGALRVHGGLLLDAGDRPAGIARLGDAVEAARDVDDTELGSALIALVVACGTDGEQAAVEPLLTEAIQVCRRWADDLPEVFRPLLVQALGLVVALTAVDAPDPDGQPAVDAPSPDARPGQPPVDRVAGLDAVTAGREAVALARKLAGADPRHRALLGHALFGLDQAVNRAGDPEEAVDLLRECVTIRRELSAEGPDQRRELARALGNLGNRLHVLDRLDEAVQAHRECLAVIRQDDSGLPPEEAVTPLRNLARTLARLDRTDEALRLAAEAENLEQGVT